MSINPTPTPSTNLLPYFTFELTHGNKSCSACPKDDSCEACDSRDACDSFGSQLLSDFQIFLLSTKQNSSLFNIVDIAVLLYTSLVTINHILYTIQVTVTINRVLYTIHVAVTINHVPCAI